MKSGLPSARPGDVIPNLREALRLAEQLRDQAVTGGIVQRLEPHDRAGAGACAVPPFREPFEQLGPAGAEQDDRDRLGMARKVLDQLEQRRLGPVRIVEEHDEGTLGGEGREQPSDRPEALRDDAGRLLQAGDMGDRLGDRVSVVIWREQRLDPRHALARSFVLLDPRRLPDHLGQWPERDALAVREAPAAEHRRASVE